MIDRLRTRLQTRLDAGRRDDGFTLIELLIVIVILGILAGIVVFAVGGITDRGNAAACKSDVKSVAVASEAYYAKNTAYATAIKAAPPATPPTDLVGAKLLRDAPSTTNGYTVGYTAATGAVTGDLTGGAVTTDCSA